MVAVVDDVDDACQRIDVDGGEEVLRSCGSARNADWRRPAIRARRTPRHQMWNRLFSLRSTSYLSRQ